MNTDDIMKNPKISRLYYIFLIGIFLIQNINGQVLYDSHFPQLEFAARELKGALVESSSEGMNISLKILADESTPESFHIKPLGENRIEIIGSDATGAMYGGLELADLLRMGLPVEDHYGKPFVGKRGIKFNIPFDARTPSYDDSGDAAQKNIETVWDFEFWKEFLDDMARYRYNVLSLWSAHPYPSIIKLDDYPEVALEDVYRIAKLIPDYRKSGKKGPWGPGLVDIDDPGVLELVKKISMNDKIAYWQKVFQYANDRGIEIYLFHWNVFTYGATGKYGITEEQDNPVTNDYLRKSVKQALLTYPQISGIGVTAGENADNEMEGKYSIENFIFNTYGKGIMDVKELQPDRKIRFIFRQHQTGLGPITEAFAEYPDEFETSFKYAIGHMYSMRRPQLFEKRGYDKEVKEYNVKCWFNLRNDDIFVLRWGSPDFVSEYIQRMPHSLSPGFYMGSDGYVWGREFVAKNPAMAGKLEIDKHWYQFRLWGQLAYNPELGREYWEAVLAYRFPGIDVHRLYDAWAASSEIIPQINTATFGANDAYIAPEGCIDFRGGFLTIDKYYFDKFFSPMAGSGIISVPDWGKAIASGEKPKGITPLEVADNLDNYAASAIEAIAPLFKQSLDNVELQETLKDILSMAYLGQYYADKMRGAAKLAVFREDRSLKTYHTEAVRHFKDAVEDWKAYAELASSQYKVQLLARTDYLDWNAILKEVEKEVITVEKEGDTY